MIWSLVNPRRRSPSLVNHSTPGRLPSTSQESPFLYRYSVTYFRHTIVIFSWGLTTIWKDKSYLRMDGNAFHTCKTSATPNGIRCFPGWARRKSTWRFCQVPQPICFWKWDGCTIPLKHHNFTLTASTAKVGDYTCTLPINPLSKGCGPCWRLPELSKSNYGVLRVLETQLTFMADGEPD